MSDIKSLSYYMHVIWLRNLTMFANSTIPQLLLPQFIAQFLLLLYQMLAL